MTLNFSKCFNMSGSSSYMPSEFNWHIFPLKLLTLSIAMLYTYATVIRKLTSLCYFYWWPISKKRYIWIFLFFFLHSWDFPKVIKINEIAFIFVKCSSLLIILRYGQDRLKFKCRSKKVFTFKGYWNEETANIISAHCKIAAPRSLNLLAQPPSSPQKTHKKQPNKQKTKSN